MNIDQVFISIQFEPTGELFREYMSKNIEFLCFRCKVKSLILYLNWNQRENLNRGVEIYLFKVNLWYCYYQTNVDDNNITNLL